MSGSYLAILPTFARDQRGSTAMVFALAMVPALAAIGLAIDYGRAHYAKDRLQNAVDAAALAGARLPATARANREQAARGVFSSNLAATNLAAVSPAISASNAEVSVAASFTMPTSFMSLIGVNSVVVNAHTRARSQVQNGGVACLLALNPSTSDGLHLQGINKLSEQNCWAWVNSTNASAINAVGASTGTAQGFCSAGGVVGADHFAPAPFTQCDPLPDPFASMFAPLSGACAATNLLVKNGTYALNPGTYCGGLILKPQADVTFNPGVYIIKDGAFEVQGQASAAGRGVVFVFTGSGTQLIVRGGGNVDFTAPTAGANGVGGLAGLLFFQDRFTTNPGSTTIIQGGGTVKMEGILYMPTWRVEIGGNGDINQTTKHWAMIADSFYMEGNGKLFIRSDPTGSGQPDILPKIPTGPLLLQ
jgi:Flp pilus assembly protein TadG